jgi:hypothetical protein
MFLSPRTLYDKRGLVRIDRKCTGSIVSHYPHQERPRLSDVGTLAVYASECSPTSENFSSPHSGE